jgi:hypothetical protein
MDNNTLNKLSLLVSVIWLVFLFVRIIMVSRIEIDPEQTELFTNVLNILLIGFIIIFGGLIFLRFGRYVSAKTMKGTHCQQCYAKMSKGQEFCPKCGWSRDPNYNKGKY